MSIKLFVETNLDTSVFLLLKPDTEIKQVRDEITKRLRQTNADLAEVSVQRVKVLFDNHSAKRDRANCFVVPDDYLLGSIVEAPVGKLFAECTKGKGVKRKREVDGKSDAAPPKKPTAAAPGKAKEQPQKKKQQQPEKEKEQEKTVSPEHKKVKPATVAKTPVLKATTADVDATTDGKTPEKTAKKKKKEKKNHKDKTTLPSPTPTSDGTSTKAKKINKKEKKRRAKAAAEAAAAAAGTTPEAAVAATPATENNKKSSQAVPYDGVSKSAKRREKRKRRMEQVQQKIEEKKTAAGKAPSQKETKDSQPTEKEIATAKAFVEKAIISDKKEDKKKKTKKKKKEETSSSDSDSPTPSPDALPVAAFVSLAAVPETQEVPPTQQLEEKEKSVEEKAAEEEKSEGEKKKTKSTGGSSSSSSSSSDDEEEVKKDKADDKKSVSSDDSDKTESEKEESEELGEDASLSPSTSPSPPSKARNTFQETDLKSLLKKAVSGKAGEKSNIEQVRADAQKEKEDGQQKSGGAGTSAGTRTTRSAGAAPPGTAADGKTGDFQWVRSHENFRADDLQKLCRSMVREAINADLKAQGQKELGPNNLYKDGVLKPDWWPIAEFSSTAIKTRENAIKIYNAAREVLSKLHKVKLEGSKTDAAKAAAAEKKSKKK